MRTKVAGLVGEGRGHFGEDGRYLFQDEGSSSLRWAATLAKAVTCFPVMDIHLPEEGGDLGRVAATFPVRDVHLPEEHGDLREGGRSLPRRGRSTPPTRSSCSNVRTRT